MEAGNDPRKAAAAAKEHAQFIADSTQMNIQTDNLSTQIQNLEGLLQREGNYMHNVFNLQQPINSCENILSRLIGQPF
jgi:hypothetical protein